MPSRARLNAFIARVVSGAHAEAIEEFYHDDATMQENLGPLRGPRATLVDQERATLARQARVITHPPDVALCDGDTVVIHWIFDFEGKDGRVRRIDELALQTWRGERIQSERFYYDPAQMK